MSFDNVLTSILTSSTYNSDFDLISLCKSLMVIGGVLVV